MNKRNLNRALNLFFTWPHLYLVIFLIFSVVAFFIEPVLGLIGTGLSMIVLCLNLFGVMKIRKQVWEYIRHATLDIGTLQEDAALRFPLPYVVMDVHGTIQWYNDKFEEICSVSEVLDENINTIIPELHIDQFPKGEETFIKEVAFDDQHYKIYGQLTTMESKKEKGSKHNYIIYFVDHTAYMDLEKEMAKQKMLVSLVFVDNYEEVMQSVEEVRRPLLVALIDRKLNTWASQADAIVRKFEKDKYLMIFSYEHLETFKQQKFDILDQVREIHIGNELPVTLSIGIGVNGKTLPRCMEYARAAIDLAMGRGGDQAVIKNVDKLAFYGGKTKEVEKSTRVKARVKAYAFRELIEEADEVLIMGHKNPDVDCLGAAIGVYRAAKLLGKKAYIVLEEPTTAIKNLYDRMLESGEYEERLFLDNVEAIGRTGEKTLLVVVDVHRPSYTQCPELLELSKKIVVFDHHRKSAEFIENAVLTYLEPYISSTCELVTEILQYIVDKVKLTSLEADALLAGITIDTKNFVFKTGVRTFEAAAFLRRNGADSTRVRLLFQNDMESYRAIATGVKDAEIYKENMAISVSLSDIPNSMIIAAQVADELLNISGITASFVMCSVDHKVVMSARSLGYINVQVIMEKLGGGGHQTVAGAQLSDCSIEKAKELLKQAIDIYLEEGEKK